MWFFFIRTFLINIFLLLWPNVFFFIRFERCNVTKWLFSYNKVKNENYQVEKIFVFLHTLVYQGSWYIKILSNCSIVKCEKQYNLINHSNKIPPTRLLANKQCIWCTSCHGIVPSPCAGSVVMLGHDHGMTGTSSRVTASSMSELCWGHHHGMTATSRRVTASSMSEWCWGHDHGMTGTSRRVTASSMSELSQSNITGTPTLQYGI